MPPNSLGPKTADEILPTPLADRQREVIVSEAYRAAQLIKGEGDAKAAAAFSDAFGRDPAFAQFYRSLEAYKSSFAGKSDVMVIDPAQVTSIILGSA